MDYKKKYENALEWARQVINGECGFIRKDVEEVFPELKESENERIRKMLIEFFGKGAECNGSTNGISDKDILAWLEKQDEQNYEFHGIAESRPAKGKLKELCQELSQSKVTKKSDQDWSKEDERNLKGIIDEIEANKNDAPDYDLATYDRFLFWLKSLKQRMQ